MTTDTIPTPRSAAYELGRVRGYATGRTEPDASDKDFAGRSLPEGNPGSAAEDFEFENGMLDGAEQARDRKLGLPVHAPKPSDEALAATRVGMVST